MTIRVSQVPSCGIAAKLADVAVGIEIGVLQRVLRLGVVPEDRARDAEQPAVVAAHQRLERCMVAGGDAGCERIWHGQVKTSLLTYSMRATPPAFPGLPRALSRRQLIDSENAAGP